MAAPVTPAAAAPNEGVRAAVASPPVTIPAPAERAPMPAAASTPPLPSRLTLPVDVYWITALAPPATTAATAMTARMGRNANLPSGSTATIGRPCTYAYGLGSEPT